MADAGGFEKSRDLSDPVDNITAGAGLLPGSVQPGGRYTGKMPVPPFRRRKL